MMRAARGKPTRRRRWISDVLIPGKDVVQVGVPTDGDQMDPGFAVNDVYSLVNRDFAEENPVAAKFLEVVEIPIPCTN